MSDPLVIMRSSVPEPLTSIPVKMNETYKLKLPESENYETLGGFIVNHTEEIPHKNQEINLGSFQFIIKEVSNTKIELVHFKII